MSATVEQSQEPSKPHEGQVSGDQTATADIDDFIYLISHDVRASVRALLELPHWIEEDLQEAGVVLNEQVQGSIDLMNRHTGRLDRMLVDLLTFSRIGRMQEVKTVDLAAALDEVLEDLQVPASFPILRDFEATHCRIGERDILTLFRALLTNAIRHHDRKAGRIIVTTRGDGDKVILTFSDDGPGIAEGFHERVFGPMTTLRPRDEVEGSGMGLAYVHKIAKLYGGGATLNSSPYGRGLCVEIRLPASRNP